VRKTLAASSGVSPTQAATDRPIASRVATALAVTLLYVGTGKLGLLFASVHVSASPIWPPAGLALAALLLLGYRVWPAVFIGAFVVNVTTAGSAATSLGIATGNTLEAVVGAWALDRFAGGASVFSRANGVFTFVMVALMSTMVSPSVGVTSLTLAGHASWGDFVSIWTTWWLGDAAGDLVVAPLLVLWARDRSLARLRERPLHAALLLATVLLTGWIAFGGAVSPSLHRLPIAFICIPALLWAAFRFGPREASTVTVLLSVLAVAGTLRGLGPFAVVPPNVALLLLQSFMGTMSVTALAVAALVWERRRAEAALRVREEQLQLALEAVGMGTWEWIVKTSAVQWSPSLEAMHGLEPGAFAGTYAASRASIHYQDRAAVDDTVRDALASGKHRLGYRVEYRIARPDGAVRWVEERGEVFADAAGRPERVLGICLDVTARKADEEDRALLLALEQAARARAEEAERRLSFLGEIARSITSSLDIDIVLQRIAEGARALSKSDTAAIFLRDDASGDMVPRFRVGPWPELYNHFRVKPGQGLGGQAMQAGRPVRTDDYRSNVRVPADFHEVANWTGTVALMVVPIITGAEVAGLLYISNRSSNGFTDEDETICVRLAEQAAIAIQNARSFSREEAARALAETASRAKDEFLAMLGHELRNPLGAISSAVHVIDQISGGDQATVEPRAVVVRQVRRLTRLIDDLLDVSRAMRGKITMECRPLDLAATVRRAVDALAANGRLAQHRVKLHGSDVWVNADDVRMEQVAVNLVENALKYTPAGGLIEVSIEQEHGAALLRVRDTGVGMAADLLSRVFEPFVQGDHSLVRSPGGLGIGLTLVRRIVEFHGGSVQAASDGPGRGSCFTVRLSVAERPVESASPAARPIESVPHRVLVIEDNGDSREMLCQMVRLLGHQVYSAADGLTGFRLALELAPDLTLVDVGLPGIDGYEVASRLRADRSGQRLRLVAVTGYGQPEDRDRARAAGFDAHVVKPIAPGQLARMLAEDQPRRA
jgi:PAS domain S-box-containing protein